jgi:5,10-methenyltetrahydrofolate synthetase
MSLSKAEIVSIKSSLRREALQSRQAMAPARHAQSSLDLAERLDGLLAAQGWQRPLVFWPWRAEPDLRELWARWRSRGLALGLPVVQALDAPLALVAWGPDDDWTSDALGLPVPVHQKAFDSDCWVVPCVAVDAEGHRLGAGKGFYDRTWASLPADRRALTLVGVCFEQARLPTPFGEPHDLRLDWVVTEQLVWEVPGPGPR